MSRKVWRHCHGFDSPYNVPVALYGNDFGASATTALEALVLYDDGAQVVARQAGRKPVVPAASAGTEGSAVEGTAVALKIDLLAQLRVAGLPAPETEYKFHSRRKWRLDYAWPGALVAVELDGGTFTAGRHNRGAGYLADCRKLNEAALAGWRVLRVTTRMVESGEALALVERALGARGWRRGQANPETLPS